MSRWFLPLAVLLPVATASAQPAPCSVVIARAPDDAREVVESWIRAEPRCTHALEVRIIPNDGDLYLFARDERGRVHERVVPDAQSAGVLIASWAADDSAPASPPVDVATVVARPAPMPAPQRETPHWIALGGMLAAGTTGNGIRGGLDVLTRGGWALGLELAVSGGTAAAYGGLEGEIRVLDTSLLGQLSWTWSAGGWHVRPAIAAGPVYTRVTQAQSAGSAMSQAGAGELIEQASLVVGHDLGDRWGIEVGPVVTLYAQHIDAPTFFFDRPLEAALFAAARYRL